MVDQKIAIKMLISNVFKMYIGYEWQILWLSKGLRNSIYEECLNKILNNIDLAIKWLSRKEKCSIYKSKVSYKGVEVGWKIKSKNNLWNKVNSNIKLKVENLNGKFRVKSIE